MAKYQVTLYRTVTDLQECTVEVECESSNFDDVLAAAVAHATSNPGIRLGWGNEQPVDTGPIDTAWSSSHDVKPIG